MTAAVWVREGVQKCKGLHERHNSGWEGHKGMHNKPCKRWRGYAKDTLWVTMGCMGAVRVRCMRMQGTDMGARKEEQMWGECISS